MKFLFLALVFPMAIPLYVAAQTIQNLQGEKTSFFSKCKDFFGGPELFLEDTDPYVIALADKEFLIRAAESIESRAKFQKLKLKNLDFRPWQGSLTITVGRLENFLSGTLRRLPKTWDDEALNYPFNQEHYAQSLWEILTYPLPAIQPGGSPDALAIRSYRPRHFPDQIYLVYRKDSERPIGAIRYTSYPKSDLSSENDLESKPSPPMNTSRMSGSRPRSDNRQTILIEGFRVNSLDGVERIYDKKVPYVVNRIW